MKTKHFLLITLLLVSIGFIILYFGDKPAKTSRSNMSKTQVVRLPQVIESSFTQLLKKRRSIRTFSSEALSSHHLSTLLWSAQGISSNKRLRTAPSAGGLYPLTIYVVVNNVKDLKKGLYQYNNINHNLVFLNENDYIKQVAQAAYKQYWIKKAAAIIIISGDYKITEKKYGHRAKLYTAIEVGTVAENLYLQASQLNLSTTLVSGINQKGIQKLLGLNELPYALMPIGNK